MKRRIRLNYKSGQHTLLTTELTPEEIGYRIKNNNVDISTDGSTMVRWSEVEAITPIGEGEPIGDKKDE